MSDIDMVATGEAHGAFPLVFTYQNYRGETSVRSVDPHRMYYGTTFYYPEPCWLLSAFDVEKGDERIFRVADIRFGDAAADMHGFIAAISVGEDPRTDEPFATVARCFRLLAARMHTACSQRDIVFNDIAIARQRIERIDAENRALRAATHEVDELRARAEDAEAELAETKAQLSRLIEQRAPSPRAGRKAR